jgi:hypothetical protein
LQLDNNSQLYNNSLQTQLFNNSLQSQLANNSQLYDNSLQATQLHYIPSNITPEPEIIELKLPEKTLNNSTIFYPTSLEPNIIPNKFELLKKQNNTRVMGIFPNLHEGKIDTCIQLDNYNVKPYDEGKGYFAI